MNSQTFEINGEKYQLLPHTGFIALNLDRKVTSLFGRMFAVGFGKDIPQEQASFLALSEALGNLSDDDYRWLVSNTLSTVTVVTEGKKNFSFNTQNPMDTIANHFAGRHMDLTIVLLKVWELEKFSPFGIPQAGGD